MKDYRKPIGNGKDDGEKPAGEGNISIQANQSKCWNCRKTGHQAKDCRFPKRESTGRSEKAFTNSMVQSDVRENPMMYLHSDSDDDEDPPVGLVRITDGGSKCGEIDSSNSVDAGKEMLTSVVNTVGSREVIPNMTERKAKLVECLKGGIANGKLTTKEHQQVLHFLENYHDV